MSTRALLIAPIVIALFWAPSGAAVITGTVQVVGAPTNADAVVYIDEIDGATFQAPESPVTMDQQGLKFIPRVLPVLVGTRVDFLNNDAVLHNVFTPDKVAGRFNLGTYPKGTVKSHTFEEVGAAVMLCNVHPEMEAFVVTLPTPYFAVTGEDGSYRIEGVPPGEYVLKVWHERWKNRPPKSVVVQDEKTVADFEITRK